MTNDRESIGICEKLSNHGLTPSSSIGTVCQPGTLRRVLRFGDAQVPFRLGMKTVTHLAWLNTRDEHRFNPWHQICTSIGPPPITRMVHKALVADAQLPQPREHIGDFRQVRVPATCLHHPDRFGQRDRAGASPSFAWALDTKGRCRMESPGSPALERI